MDIILVETKSWHTVNSLGKSWLKLTEDPLRALNSSEYHISLSYVFLLKDKLYGQNYHVLVPRLLTSPSYCSLSWGLIEKLKCSFSSETESNKKYSKYSRIKSRKFFTVRSRESLGSELCRKLSFYKPVTRGVSHYFHSLGEDFIMIIISC